MAGGTGRRETVSVFKKARFRLVLLEMTTAVRLIKPAWGCLIARTTFLLSKLWSGECVR